MFKVRTMRSSDDPADIIRFFERKAKEKARKMGWNGGGSGGGGGSSKGFRFAGARALALVGAVLVITGVLSAFYTIEPDEQGVVLRFGRFHTITEPGLHFKLPYGIDEAIKVKTKLVLQQEFGFRTRSVEGSRTEFDPRSYEKESLMLTGDLNVADVEWTVQFQISDPQKFLFQTRDPITNVRDVSQAIMRRVVGDRLVTDVLTVGRSEISTVALELMQDVLDHYDMGVRVVSIKLQDVNPPGPVKPSFNEVNAAKQEQEQLINQAERKYNEVIPAARGEAQKKIADARGYATAVVNRAEGEASRFLQVLQEYKVAPRVTKKRLYVEALEEVLGETGGFTLVDSEIKGVLPLFMKPGGMADLAAHEGGGQKRE